MTKENIKLGKVLGIFSATIGTSGLPRPKVENLNLIENYGIKNDKFANDDLNKTVMIIGIKSYNIAKNHGINLLYGSYGENLLFDFDPHELEVEEILQINDAIIQIKEKCTLCNHLSVFGKQLPKLIKNHRGLYCKILKSGIIKKNSSVFVKSNIKKSA